MTKETSSQELNVFNLERDNRREIVENIYACIPIVNIS